MMCLQATSWLPLILKVDGKGSTLCIDETYDVHADMKGHDGGVFVTAGAGAVYASSSTKSKINTVSLTETEVIRE